MAIEMLFKSINLNLPFLRHFLILFVVVAGNLFMSPEVIFIIQTIVAVYLVSYGIKNRRNLDVYDVLVSLFSLYVIIVTAARGNLTPGIFYSLVIIATLTVYIKQELHKSNQILKSIYLLHATLLVANFMTLFFPSTDQSGAPHYLLGGKNALAILIVPSMFYIAYYSRAIHNKLTSKNALLIAISVLTLFMSGSSTGIVLAIIASLSILFIHRIKIGHFVYLALFAVAQVFIISTQKLYEIPYFVNFVTNYLGKDLTFSGRTSVWEVVMNAIGNSFFGYGRGNSVVSSYFGKLSETHNMILEVLLTGGVILLTLFGIIVLGVFSFRKMKSNISLYRLSAFFLFLYFILGLTESVPFKIDLWIMFAIIISTNSIITNSQNKK